MHKELPKAATEQIEEQIRSFVGSGGGGKCSFNLTCKLCRDVGVISTTEHGIKSKKEKLKATIKFSKQGWRVDGYELVCPKCFKRNF